MSNKAKPAITRVYGARRIEEDIQAPIRKRLRFLRQSRHLQAKEIKSIAASTLTGYELHDISTMKLGDMHALSQELGITFAEFMQALCVGTNAEVVPAHEEIATARIRAMLAGMAPDQRQLAIDLVHRVSTFAMDGRQNERLPSDTSSASGAKEAATPETSVLAAQAKG